jgi:phosphonate transport system substrate-binding protein
MGFLLCALLLAAAEPTAPLRLAIPAPLGEARAQKDAAELARVLGALLRRPVHAEVASAAVLPQLLAEGKVDVAWLSAAGYVEASARASVLPAARLVRGGMPFYRSAIFVKARGPVRQLKDLKGKRLAFVSEESSAGFVLARQVLVSAGFGSADLRGEQFLGDHGAVCRAVLEGAADGGATFANDGRGGALAGCDETLGAGKTKALRVLATSDPIPNDVVALRPGAPRELHAAIREALLSLARSAEGRRELEAIFHADAFIAADDADFALLREARAGGRSRR